MGKTYTSRICCSDLNKHLINTLCRKKLLKSKPELENVVVSENTILTSMIKFYTGHVSLEEFADEFHKSRNSK